MQGTCFKRVAAITLEMRSLKKESLSHQVGSGIPLLQWSREVPMHERGRFQGLGGGSNYKTQTIVSVNLRMCSINEIIDLNTAFGLRSKNPEDSPL